MFLFASFWLVSKIRIILILNHNSELVQTIGGICIQITFLNSAKIFGSSRIRIQTNPSTEFSYLFCYCSLKFVAKQFAPFGFIGKTVLLYWELFARCTLFEIFESIIVFLYINYKVRNSFFPIKQFPLFKLCKGVLNNSREFFTMCLV